MNISQILVLIAITLILAFLVESLVEYFAGILLARFTGLKKWKWLTPYLAAIVGVVLAFHWRIDLVDLAAHYLANLMSTDIPWHPSPVGFFISGCAIGRGSNFLHDVYSRFKEPVLPDEREAL